MNLLSCLQVTIQRVGGMTCSFERIGGMSATATRVGGMSASFGLVCGTDIGGNDVLWASDQMVITVTGDKIYVTV